MSEEQGKRWSIRRHVSNDIATDYLIDPDGNAVGVLMVQQERVLALLNAAEAALEDGK